jgi:hypothetical protein
MLGQCKHPQMEQFDDGTLQSTSTVEAVGPYRPRHSASAGSAEVRDQEAIKAKLKELRQRFPAASFQYI